MPTQIVDGTITPYTTQALAQAAIDNGSHDCIVQLAYPADGTIRSLTIGHAGQIIQIDEQKDSSNPTTAKADEIFLFRLFMTAGALSVGFNLSTSFSVDELDFAALVFADDGTTFIDGGFSDIPNTSTNVGTFHLTIPADGYYYFEIVWLGTKAGASDSFLAILACTSTFPGGLQICRIQAAYNTGGSDQYVNCVTI